MSWRHFGHLDNRVVCDYSLSHYVERSRTISLIILMHMQRDHTPFIMDTFRLNTTICNKCFTLKYRSKQPYLLTQCGHIFCQECWQKADKQCTLCGNNEVVTVELSEQLPPKVKRFFEPLAKTLNTFFLEILRIEEFRNDQLKITIQRFTELEKKYDILKRQYWAVLQDLKALMKKYTNLRSEKIKLNKKLLTGQVKHDPLQRVFNTIQTPTNSNILNHPYSSGYSSESMGLHSMSGISGDRLDSRKTPVQSVDSRKEHKTVDGFRIPIKRKDITHFNSYDKLNSNSKRLFMR